MEGNGLFSQLLPVGITIGAVAVGAALGDFVKITDELMEYINAFVVGLFIYQLASYDNLSKTALAVAVGSAVGVGLAERFLEYKMGAPFIFYLFMSGYAVGRPGLQFWSSTPFHIAFSNLVVSFLFAEGVSAGQKLASSIGAILAPIVGFLSSKYGYLIDVQIFNGLLAGAQASVLFGSLIPRQKTPSIAASLLGYFSPSIISEFLR